VLVNSNGDHVQGLDGQGQLVDINVNAFSRGTPKATSVLHFAGNLSSTVSTPSVDTTVNGVQVYDANGVSHPVNLTFKNNGNGDYTVAIADPSGTEITTASLKFSAGFPSAASSLVTFDYQPDGGKKTSITLDFSQGVTSLAQTSTLAVSSQDGYEAGTKVDQTIGADGVVTIHYSNGQTGEGGRLVLADFGSEQDLQQAGGSMFAMNKGAQVQYGVAGADGFGRLMVGHREGSNVDMAEEFSNLILMQRGYQASSHVISTANDMIQELFDMKGHR
jgi:flagellar hook protein FlgE